MTSLIINPAHAFEIEAEAKRLKLKASIMIEALPGNGKTGAALMFAAALAKFDLLDELNKNPTKEEIWLNVGGADSEKRSMNLYIDAPIETTANELLHVKPFRKVNLNYYAPQIYLAAREQLISQFNIKSFIMDSYSHAWIGDPGGVLDLVTRVTKEIQEGNPEYRAYKASAWGHPDVKEGKKLLVDLLRDSRVHTIATVRLHEAVSIEKNDEGKTEVKSAGLQQYQQDALKYEPDLGIRMLEPGKFIVFKSRYTKIFKKGETYELTWKICEDLARYLKEGADPEEILEQRRLDTIETLKNMAKENPMLATMYKTLYPDTKSDDLTLDQAHGILIKFMEAIPSGTQRN